MVAMLKSIRGAHEDHEEPQGKNLLRSDTFRAPPVARAMMKAKGDAHDADVFSVTQLTTTAIISAIREITPRAFPPTIWLRLAMSPAHENSGYDNH